MKKIKEQIKSYSIEETNSTSVREALMKKALGYQVSEVTEEYSMVDKNLVLVKKKINTKQYPPDLDAIELALNGEEYKSSYEKFTDKELLEEKQKVIDMLEKINKGEVDDSN